MKVLFKSFLFLVFLLTVVLPLHAQFLGGNGDGSASLKHVAILNSQPDYCSGGDGNGYTQSGFTGAMFNSSAYCSGGHGDGSSQAVFGPLCLVDQTPWCSGGNGNGYVLAGTSFNLGTGMWKGLVSSDWSAPLNWTNSHIPDVTNDVIIPPFCPNYPSLPGGLLSIGSNTGTFRCRNMIIEEGAQVSSMGNTEIAGLFSVVGQYVATSNAINSQIILESGHLAIEPYGLVRLGNQSSGPAICDLRVSNGGQLTVNGGALEIDDQLILQSGSTFTMTGGTVFVHRFGEGSQPDPLNPGAFYVQEGVSGSISGGLLKVCGKTSDPPYASVFINEPSFEFTGSGTLMFTTGISSNGYDADIVTAPGVGLNHLLIDKPGNTIAIRSNLVIGGVLMIYNGSAYPLNK